MHFFWFFWDLFGIFLFFVIFEIFGYLGFFYLFFTKSFQGYYQKPKMKKNGLKQQNKVFFCPNGKKSLDQSPPQELEVGPHSGPYLLVFGNLSTLSDIRKGQFCLGSLFARGGGILWEQCSNRISHLFTCPYVI